MSITNKVKIKTNELVLCSLFTTLIAIGAFIKIPIPVVPFTLQFLFTNLAGLLLGRKLGFFSVSAYVLIGLLGIPVFTSGGGIGYIFQPTFGYIIGFVVGSTVAGYIIERFKSKRTYVIYLIAGFINLIIVYIMGMTYYYFIANYYLNSPISVWSLFLYCFLLAVPGDLFLCIISALLASRLKYVLKEGIQ